MPLGKIGSFDRVSAAYLIRTVYDNLEPGQPFVAGIANPLLPPRPVFDQRKSGASPRRKGRRDPL